MFQFKLPIIESAERIAAEGGAIDLVLDELRKLSLDDFGLLFIGLPNKRYPALSKLLPAMATDEVQRNWTGASGEELYRQTSSFVRQVENNFTRFVGGPLRGARIMDFGCGYGRIFRMMYYYANPSDLWGVDAWPVSLDHCKSCALPGNFALSQAVPDALPVGDARFDIIYAFSVFTHLSPVAAKACSAAIRNVVDPNGIFVCTVRPVEFWAYIDSIQKTAHAEQMYSDHTMKGFAYLPQTGSVGATYGDSSIDFEFFSQNGWEILGYDWSLLDPYQVSLILRAK